MFLPIVRSKESRKNMDNLNLKISASPHVRSKCQTSDIMFDVVLALIPASCFGVYQFGWHAALLIAVCIASSVLFEAGYELLLKRKVTVGDFSAVVTGLLLALNLPPELPWWMAVLGSAFAIIIVKQLFGGLGCNFMNPALGARCFLLLSFGRFMTQFVFDGVSTATPLYLLKTTGDVDMSGIKDMFFGYTAGTIGETSVVAILIGAAYLLIKKVISPKIPMIYIGTLAIAVAIYAWSKDYNVLNFTLGHVCGGGLMLGAWFMATDYVTSPITPVGKIIYAVILGLLTFVIRIFGNNAEGVSFAIIITNLLVPLIEIVTVPKFFGKGAEISKEEAKAKKQEEKLAKKTALDEEEAKENEKTEDTDNAPKKKEGVFKAIFVIMIITLVLGAALGTVYNVTKDPIKETEAKAKEDAYKKAYPEAATINVPSDSGSDAASELYAQMNDFIAQWGYTSDTINEICGALDKDKHLLGYVVDITAHDGYSGDVRCIIGISSDGFIKGIEYLDLNESPGLGMNADSKEFKNQMIGKNCHHYTYTKNGATEVSEVDAIAGATITTSAVVTAVDATVLLVTFLGGGM